MTDDETVKLGSMILKRAGKEMLEAGIDPAAVPHVMAGYATLLISCHCPEHRYLEAQKMRTGIEEVWRNLTKDETH